MQLMKKDKNDGNEEPLTMSQAGAQVLFSF